MLLRFFQRSHRMLPVALFLAIAIAASITKPTAATPAPTPTTSAPGQYSFGCGGCLRVNPSGIIVGPDGDPWLGKFPAPGPGTAGVIKVTSGVEAIQIRGASSVMLVVSGNRVLLNMNGRNIGVIEQP